MTTILNVSLALALGALALAIMVCFVRIVRGPTLPDRVLALDLLAIAGAGLMAVAGISFDSDVFLDVALILVVTGFVGTAAFARFIEGREIRPRGGPP
jgi:multicomponent Na+:H+ antiporter subunit F